MSEIRGEPDAGSISLLIAVAMGLMALAVGVLVARPFSAASIAFDSQVAVLHAERIASGQHLEAYILTTPKPLLTAVFGTLYALTTDWRSLAWATIAAYAVAVAAATVLAYRLRGLIAALFSGVALILTPTLLFDVGFDEPDALRWLFTSDDTLPGTPIQAMTEHRGTEVNRRAQALAF